MKRALVIAVVVGLLLLVWWAPWNREDPLHGTEGPQAGAPPQSSAMSAPVETLPGIQERVPAESAEASRAAGKSATQTELRGYVTWRVNGESVAGVRVVAYVSDGEPPSAEAVMSLTAGTELLASAESDSRGHFAISGL
ncbi:MAG: hypothetical protein ABI054_11095, partial [Planctomycetota bacterium]